MTGVQHEEEGKRVAFKFLFSIGGDQKGCCAHVVGEMR